MFKIILLLFAAIIAIIVLLSRKGHTTKTNGEIYNVTGSKKASERLGYTAPDQTVSTVAKPTVNQAKTSDLKNTKKHISRLAGKKSYGPQVDPIIREGENAVAEMEQLQQQINESVIQGKISEIISITDKIMDNLTEDAKDVPQVKKFFRYYLPTTIKLLHSYRTLVSQGIEGENINKGLQSIEEMLDVSIVAFKKRLDSMFADQALDIETEIDVMNQMLYREGLSEQIDFTEFTATSAVEAAASAFSTNNASAAMAQAQQKG